MAYVCTYIGEKYFDSVEDLVADGLIVLHMEKHNVVSFIDDAREAAQQSAVQTSPASSVIKVPQTVTAANVHSVHEVRYIQLQYTPLI